MLQHCYMLDAFFGHCIINSRLMNDLQKSTSSRCRVLSFFFCACPTVRQAKRRAGAAPSNQNVGSDGDNNVVDDFWAPSMCHEYDFFFGKTLKQHFFKMEAEIFKILDKKIGPSSKPGARMFQARSGMGIEGWNHWRSPVLGGKTMLSF